MSPPVPRVTLERSGTLAPDVPCPYCGKGARYWPTSAHLYSGREYGPVWECAPCQAWVGCHPDGRPLGRLADRSLRQAKMKAHEAFDPMWKAKARKERIGAKAARNAGYAWLARQLGIEREDCHIGMFDLAMCNRVVAVCMSAREMAATRADMRAKGIGPPQKAGMPPLRGNGVPAP